jgi:glycosyltransferase EpsF
VNYYRHIDTSKVEFDFVVDDDSPYVLPDDVMTKGAIIYRIPAYTHTMAYIHRLIEIIKINHYMIVHVHMNSMSFIALFVSMLAGVPVRICHNHTTAHGAEGIRAILKYIFRPLNIMFATDYFACGEHAAIWMYGNKRFESGRVYLMRNFVDAEKFRFSQEKRNRIRDELGIRDSDFVVGHVGRFVQQKNHTFLIDIIAALVKVRPNSVLIMIGDGPLKEGIYYKVTVLGLTDNIRFVGSVTNPEDYYSAMDVFCLPSLFEGLAIVCLEAQANSLCSLCSLYVPPDGKLPQFYNVLRLEEGAAVWARKLLRFCTNYKNTREFLQNF